MARVSFTLRRPDTDADKGSYLRFDDTVAYDTGGAGGASVAVGIGSRTDYDSALRADGIQLAATDTFDASFFDATSVCYGEVSLTWAVNIATTLTASPQVMGIVLVYSDVGEPQTISSGTILVESGNTFSFEHTGLMEGRWAYYSLFVNYRSSGGDNYFERAASLSVIVPKNYGSNLMLWNRIPEYYRTQDTLMGDTDYSPCIGNVEPGTPVGPLFKFLSVFGFDMDRIRTLLDYIMVAQDPSLANSETLDAISQQMATELLSSDLGAARLRTLLSDVGFFRRSKGTLEGTSFYAKAISGSDVEFDTATGEITVYSQRVNYITDPKDASTITTSRGVYDAEIDNMYPFDVLDSALVIPGVANSTATTPDDPLLNLASDSMEIVVKMSMDDWTPAAVVAIVSRRGSASDIAFSLTLTTSGIMQLDTSPNGTTAQAHQAASAPYTSLTNQAIWLKATRDTDNGSAQYTTNFYWATGSENEPSVWTQIGTEQATANGGLTGFFDSTRKLEIGARLDTQQLIRARFYRVIIRNGIGGSAVFDCDFEHDLTSSSQTTINEQANNLVVTRNNTASFEYFATPPNTYTQSGTVYSSTPTGDSANAEGVMLKLSSPIPVRLGTDRAIFSAQGNTGPNPIEWVRLVDANGVVIGSERNPVVVNGTPFYEIEALNSQVPSVVQASANNNGGGRNMTCTFTNAPAENDIVIIFGNCTTLGKAHTYPTDGSWVNALDAGTETVVASDAHQVHVIYHVVTAAEALANTKTFTCTNYFDTTESVGNVAFHVTNADPNSPISSWAGAASPTPSASFPWPTITAGDDDNCLLLVGSCADLGGTSPTFVAWPPEFIQMAENTLFTNMTGFKGTRLLQANDTVGPWTATYNSSSEEPATAILAIRPRPPQDQPLGSSVTGYIELMLDLRSGATFNMSSVMVERNHIGTYFDGDTVRGGWLIDTSSVSDYRWSATANASPSIFTEEYERTKGVIDALLFDVLPITEASKYHIVSYNAIPGL